MDYFRSTVGMTGHLHRVQEFAAYPEGYPDTHHIWGITGLPVRVLGLRLDAYCLDRLSDRPAEWKQDVLHNASGGIWNFASVTIVPKAGHFVRVYSLHSSLALY